MGPALADGVNVAAIIGGLAAIAMILVATSRGSGFRSRQTHRRYRDATPADQPTPWDRPRETRGWLYADSQARKDDLIAARHVRAVTGTSFQKKRILNGGEHRIFRIVENELISTRRGYRAFAQTSLGEILDSSSHDAFHAINAKRVDILVVDSGGWPVLAIEYQGEGHYQGTAVARDTIKNLALRSAGIGYLEIFNTDGDNDIRVQLRKHLAQDRRGPAVVALRDPA